MKSGASAGSTTGLRTAPGSTGGSSVNKTFPFPGGKTISFGQAERAAKQKGLMDSNMAYLYGGSGPGGDWPFPTSLGGAVSGGESGASALSSPRPNQASTDQTTRKRRSLGYGA